MNKINNKDNIFVIFTFFCLFLGYGFFPTVFERISVRISSPLFALADSIKYSTNNVLETLFVSTKTLLDDRDYIIKNNNKLLSENSFLRSKLKFNYTNILDINKVVNAIVLVGPPRTRFDKIILSKGISSGIKSGAKVYSINENLIGFIADSSRYYSTVKLFSSPTSIVSVSIDGFLATASGTGSGGVLIEVPSTTKVSLNDIVYLQDTKQFPIAKIVAIEKTPSDPVQTIYAHLNVGIYNLSSVFVEKYEQL